MSHRNDRSQTDPPGRAGADGADGAALQKRTIADFYSRVAAAYDGVGPAVFARFGEHSVAVAGIGAGAHVLDVAAGRGANLFPAAAAVGVSGRVVGIDLAPEMVALTARAIAERGLTNATMLHMDAEALRFADASFDVVLCSFAYFLFPHVDGALAEFARVLRAGGTLLLTTHGLTDERWRWYDEMLVATYARQGLPWPYTGGGGRRRIDELEDLLADAGFTDLRQVPVEVEAVYATGEEWWAAKWTHGARRALESLPPDILPAFASEVNVRLAGLQQTDGIHERWRIVCLLGTKSATWRPVPGGQPTAQQSRHELRTGAESVAVYWRRRFPANSGRDPYVYCAECLAGLSVARRCATWKRRRHLTVAVTASPA